MNVKKLMEQARQMQGKMEEELDALRVEATVGGGAVKVTMNGRKQALAVDIEADAVDGEDTTLLQDLVMAAINEAGRKVDEEMQQKMGGMMPGMGGLF